tara:strand:+ start:918 stop:1052 length:135 start_codon:yes stop_codon:yes gene_type:complete
MKQNNYLKEEENKFDLTKHKCKECGKISEYEDYCSSKCWIKQKL